MTLESTIEAYLVKRVEALGGICLKGAVPGRRFIDRICIMPLSVVIWIECKKPKNGAKRAQQSHYISLLQGMGHEAVFVKTKDEVDAVMSWYLEQAGAQTR